MDKNTARTIGDHLAWGGAWYITTRDANSPLARAAAVEVTGA